MDRISIPAHVVATFLIASALVLSSCAKAQKPDEFTPGAPWPDSDGNHINAHGGGILYHEGKYYWYGEKRGERESQGINLYSSSDLYNWTFERTVLEPSNDPDSDIAWGSIMERPKVLYNDATRKFVMWFHLELRGQAYKAARTAVAVSDRVEGPFAFLKSMRPDAGVWPRNLDGQEGSPSWNIFQRDFDGGQMARDMTLFKDDDGRAYHVFSSEENHTLHIALLSDDYLSHSETVTRVLPGGRNEAPAVFKHAGQYYLMTSGTTGWDANPARSFRADSMLGEWKPLGNPATGFSAETTFGSQSTFVLELPDRKDAYIYMGDRWQPGDLKNSPYVWLPVTLGDQSFTLQWVDHWSLRVFGQFSRQ